MSTEERIHFAVFGEWNARKGEALAQTERVHSLLKLRAFLLRGRLHEARHELDSLKATRPEARSEVLLEEARLQGHNGCWANVLRASDEGLALAPQPVTRLALYQCRSMAAFELGKFQKSIEDLERIESLAVALPFSNLVIYGQATRAKISARDRGWKDARAELDRAWARSSTEPNVDTALALLRTEADIARVCGRESIEPAWAAFLLADAIGDRLYREISRLEAGLAAADPNRSLLLNEAHERGREFERVRKLIAEIGGTPETSSALALNKADLRLSCRELLRGVSHLVIGPARQVVSLKDLQVISRPAAGRYFVALDQLAFGPISKEQFFTRYWKLPKFIRESHDGPLRTLLSRARKELAIEIQAEAGKISAPNSWVVRTSAGAPDG